MQRTSRTTTGLVLGAVLALSLAACGSGGDSGDDKGAAPSKGDYCALVKAARNSVSPAMPTSLSSGNPGPADMRKWIDDVARPEIAKTDAIIAAAPADAVADWKQLRKLEQNMVDGLRSLATRQNQAAWAKMNRQQRLTELLTVMSGMSKGVDKSLPSRIRTQVQAYCGIQLDVS